jgi:hypothetical protein
MAAAKAPQPSYLVTGMSIGDSRQVRSLVDASAGSDTEQAAAHRARG